MQRINQPEMKLRESESDYRQVKIPFADSLKLLCSELRSKRSLKYSAKQPTGQVIVI
jgi:hypothetical protein